MAESDVCQPTHLDQTKQDNELANHDLASAHIADVVAEECASTDSVGDRYNEEESSLDDCSDVGTCSGSDDRSDDDHDDDGDDEGVDEFVDAGEDVDTGERELWISERRHSGDGEEQPDKASDLRKLDDDQDRQNPAYVPRKGAFFEHDLRRNDDDDDEQEKKEKSGSKKLWLESKKWQHDRFDERSQAPKSREEIVAAYGFDIRTAREGEASNESRSRNGKRARANRRSRGSELGEYITVPIGKEEASESQVSGDPNTYQVDGVALVETMQETSEERQVPRVTTQSSGRSGRGGREQGLRRGGGNQELSAATSRTAERRIIKYSDETRRRRRDGGTRLNATPTNDESQTVSSKIDRSTKSAVPASAAQAVRRSRTIITNDRRSGFQSSLRFGGSSDAGSAAGTVCITIVTESQDARRTLPDAPRSITSVAGSERRSDRKSTVIVHTTMAPEIIPPMTRVVTYLKSAKPIKSKASHSTTSDDTTVVSSRGWTGGEFTPAACRSMPTLASDVSVNSSNSSIRTKRYSSQRQRNLPESGIADQSTLEGALTTTSVAHSQHIVSVTSVLPLQSRPIAAAAFYANPPPSLQPGQIPLFAGPGTQMVGTQSILHPSYMGRAGPVPMLPPSSFIAASQVIGYGPPMASPTGANFVPIPFAGVPIPEVGSNPLEVRGGTVYFSPEAQKPAADQRGGTIYFDPGQQAAAAVGVRSPARRPKAAIPIVNPQDLKELKQSDVSELAEQETLPSLTGTEPPDVTSVDAPQDNQKTDEVLVPDDPAKAGEE